MKKIQKYMMALLSLGVVAAGVVGCSDDDEYTLKSVSAKPSDKFNAKIQFVSRLTDAPLITSDADYQALKGYMVNTLNKREKSWLTVLDRTDNSRLSDVMQLSVDTYRWTASAFNKLGGKTVFEGSTLFFNEPTRLVRSVEAGAGSRVASFSPLMKGTRTDRGEDGEGGATVDISFNINFYTVRFDAADQLSAFGGEEGVMNRLKRENMNLLMIGTVKNDLFGTLEQTVGATDSSFKVYKVAAGSEYSVFMLAEERFWGFTGVDTESLGNGIEAYSINVMW